VLGEGVGKMEFWGLRKGRRGWGELGKAGKGVAKGSKDRGSQFAMERVIHNPPIFKKMAKEPAIVTQ
jgi:hypothetical protein